MNDPGERTYTLNWEVIDRIRKEQMRISTKKLIELTGMHRTTISRTKKGQKTFWNTVVKIAGVLQVEPYDIIAFGEPVSHQGEMVDIDCLLQSSGLRKLTDEQKIDVVYRILEDIKPKYQVTIMKMADGSLKFTLRLAREDADKLRALIESGQITKHGTLSITGMRPADYPASWSQEMEDILTPLRLYFNYIIDFQRKKNITTSAHYQFEIDNNDYSDIRMIQPLVNDIITQLFGANAVHRYANLLSCIVYGCTIWEIAKEEGVDLLDAEKRIRLIRDSLKKSSWRKRSGSLYLPPYQE